MRAPPRVLRALEQVPQLGAHACRAVAYRDARDEGQLVSARRFLANRGPARAGAGGPGALEAGVVRLTRCLFAQLTGGPLSLPRRVRDMVEAGAGGERKGEGGLGTDGGVQSGGDGTAGGNGEVSSTSGSSSSKAQAMYGLRLWAGLEILAGRAARAGRHESAARARHRREQGVEGKEAARRMRLVARLLRLREEAGREAEARASKSGVGAGAGAGSDLGTGEAGRKAAEVGRLIAAMDPMHRAGVTSADEAVRSAIREAELAGPSVASASSGPSLPPSADSPASDSAAASNSPVPSASALEAKLTKVSRCLRATSSTTGDGVANEV